MQDSMGKSALRFGNNGSSVTKPDVKNFEPPCSNSLPSSEQNFRPLNLYYRKCWQPRLTPSTAWISSWPSSTVNPHLSRSPTATSSANVASRVPPSRSRTNANCTPSGSEATTMVAGITEFSRPWRKPMSTCAMKQRRKRQSEQREKPSGWCGWSVGWESDWWWRTRIELVWTSITLPAFLTIYKIPYLSAQNRRQATFLVWLVKGQNFLGSLPSLYYPDRISSRIASPAAPGCQHSID